MYYRISKHMGMTTHHLGMGLFAHRLQIKAPLFFIEMDQKAENKEDIAAFFTHRRRIAGFYRLDKLAALLQQILLHGLWGLPPVPGASTFAAQPLDEIKQAVNSLGSTLPGHAHPPYQPAQAAGALR